MKRGMIASNRASATSELRYNLFRHKFRPELRCAVPEDQPVPSFVTGEQWAFSGTLEDIFSPSLNPNTPGPVVHLNGFHLFQIVSSKEESMMSENPRRGDRRELSEEFELLLED